MASRISPFVAEWDERQGFPRSLHCEAAAAVRACVAAHALHACHLLNTHGCACVRVQGVYAPQYPASLGGTPPDGRDALHDVIWAQEFARCGAGGVVASLTTHAIGLPPVLHAGCAAMQAKVVPEVTRGDKLIALAITEPGAGSDVAALSTTARKQGDVYVLSGCKVPITSGVRADYVTVAARTLTEAGDSVGISLFLVEKGAPGFTQAGPVQKMGWWAADAGLLTFDGVRVPASQLIGEPGKGFAVIMNNFNAERLMLSTQATMYARVCTEAALTYAQQRKTFGARLADHQVIRHKVADMWRQVLATEALLYNTAQKIDRLGGSGSSSVHRSLVADLSLLKVQSSLTMEYCAREAMQILGGAGYMRGNVVERLYREVRDCFCSHRIDGL